MHSTLHENQATTQFRAEFGRIFEACPEAMLVLMPAEDRIIDANPAACRLLGYDRDILRGMSVTALHPGQLPALIVFTDGVQAKGEYWTRGLKPRHAAGHELSLEYSASLLKRGGHSELLLMMNDLATQRKRSVDTEADLYVRGGLEEW